MFGNATSYTGFYSLPQWTQHTFHQPYPIHQQPYSQISLTPYPQQYTYTDVPRVGQSRQPFANNVPEAPIRRKRASRPKVRTGCTTCKIRRVKCDEGKPACLRCTSTGRKCDGYRYESSPCRKDLPVRRDSTPPTVPPRETTEVVKKETSSVPHLLPPSIPQLPLPTTFEGTVQERRTFHRFRYRTVPAFSGGSESEFWTVLVLQTAVSEPVIREAIIALGTLHEDYENRGGVYCQEALASAAYKESALLYGRAIRGLYQRIDTISGDTTNLAIIASIIFACFEVLRRNNMAAVVHYQNGMRALMKQMNERDQKQIDGVLESRKENGSMRTGPQDDLDQMLRVFARHDIQSCTFSKSKTDMLSVKLTEVPPNEVGLTEVRRYLDNLLIAVYQLVKSDLSMFRYWKTAEVSVAWVNKRDQALATFQGWLVVLDRSIPSDAMTLRNHGILASKSILGLILQIKVAMIMLKTCIDCGPETSYDQFTPDFEEMVSRVEHLTRTLNMRAGIPLERETVPFSMELGVTHPLFFVAWKCRDRSVRRRAIAELRKCGKEGVWEGPIMAMVAQRIVDLEERGVPEESDIPESVRIHDIRKAVEYDERVVTAEFKVAKDSSWKKWETIRQRIDF